MFRARVETSGVAVQGLLKTVAVSACTGAAILAATAALAQQVPNAGSTLRQLESLPLTLPKTPPPAVEIETPRGLVLKPATALLRFTLKAFRITGATVIAEAELQQLLQDYVEREVGILDLGEAVGRLTRLYFQRGYPLATAHLPAQDIQDGVVQIAIIEGRFGKIEIRNRSEVQEATISSFVEGLPGRVVEEASLERKLLLIYDLPGVLPAQAVLHPGQEIGETDLRLELAPGPAIAAGSLELDNYGNRFTGGSRLSGQLDLFSPLRLGDWLSLRATKGDPGLDYTRIGYQLPLGGDGVQLGAAYSHAEYSLGKDFAALDANGEAGTWSGFVSYPFIRSRRFSSYGRASYERRDFQDRAALNVSDKASELVTLTLSGNHFDAVGAGAASAFSLSYTSGGLRIETPADKAADDASLRTDGSFHKWNLSFARLQNLTEPLSLFVSFYAQKAGKNLDSSEKLILGGANAVRAYPQGEAPGDTGYLLTGELRYTLNFGALPGSFQLAAFIDTGEVKLNEEPFTAGANRRRLSGGGVGLIWGKANDFTMRLSLAHRISNERATAGTDSQSRAWLQAIKYF